jgi:hypothetical protein
MGSPRRNNPNRISSPREYNEEGPAFDHPNRLPPLLAIIAAAVDAFQPMFIGKNPRRMREVEPALHEGQTAFRFVPLEYHMGGNAV